MLDLADAVIALTDSTSKIIQLPLPHDGPKHGQPDIALAKAKLNRWESQVQLSEALIISIAYFKAIL